MAEERSDGRGRRRRYFRPKKQKDAGSSPNSANSGKAASTQGDETRSSNTRNRKARRRTRSRPRPGEESRNQVVTEMDVAYVAPQAVFVYTHSSNPDVRDTYEFRPEHFSNVGRRLDDYQIDIAKLFKGEEVAADGTPVLAKLSPPIYNWDEWEEEDSATGKE